jgi:hypothetical protein
VEQEDLVLFQMDKPEQLAIRSVVLVEMEDLLRPHSEWPSLHHLIKAEEAEEVVVPLEGIVYLHHRFPFPEQLGVVELGEIVLFKRVQEVQVLFRLFISLGSMNPSHGNIK